MKIGTISVVIFFCLIHFFTPAFGAVINVPAEYTTIQAAIDVSVDGDTILVADGTYEGAGNVNSDFAGKAITVKSVNGPANCIIDGKNQNRGFYFHSGEGNNSVISGFTIKNGFSPSKGGGILFINSSPSIINCIITEISFGYGLFCENSSPSLNNCVVRNNIEGGIYCENSSPVIMNCTISENAGIGICCKTSSPIISYSVISKNSSFYGGGIYCKSSDLNITFSTISENEAIEAGGGIYLMQSSTPIIENCTIISNQVNGNGGGIYSEESSPVIKNCIIAKNISYNTYGRYGGGIFCYSSSQNSSPISITNCIIANNKASAGGGIYCERNSPIITNCTITKNEGGSGVGVFYDFSSPTIKNSIIWGGMSTNPISGIGTLNPAVTYSNIQFAYIGEGNIDIDPQFVDSSNDNFYLKSNSKCIDTGTSNGAPDLDIENKIRPRDSGFDMGAYETYLVVDVVPYSPNPTNTNNLLNFSWNDVPGVNTYTFMCFNKLNPDNYIEVNNIAQNTYTIISALSDGSWCWKVMAFDENQISGKWSPIDTFIIDTIAPTVEIAGQPISPTKINSISLTIGGNGVTSYKYSFNNGPYGDETLITTPIDLLNLDDGAYMLSVVGKDAAGNLQSESLSTNISWIIDTVSPIITGLENDYSPSKQKVWTWDAIDDNVTSFRYMIDKSEFWNDPSGVYADVREAILSDEDGTWYLHVQAKDAAGHESDIHTVMVRMDNTPPIATVLGLPPTQTNSTSVTLQVSGDDVTHYRFGIDGGEYSGETSVEESITIHNLSDGHHVVSVLGRDSAGNWQATASVAEWMVDTVAPAAIVLDVPAEITGLTELSLVIDNTDVTHYKYSINGADYSDEFPSDTPLLVSNLADGKYTMSFLGRDRSGNWQDEDKATIVSWTVDTTPPSKVGDAYAVSGNGVVSLYWKNPSDSDFGRIIICSSLIAFPFSPEGCNVLYEGTREEFVDSQVTNKLTYYYSIFTTDGLNTSGATEITATPNARPIAQDQIVGIAGDVTTGILLSATDDDGDQLAYTTIVTNPSDGLISGTPPNVSYVANRDYYGVDRFTFVASDDSEESNAGTVTINIHSADSDADGVVNQWDACPGTRTDTYVDRHGCPDEIVWDINGDGKIGLEEAIRALQVVSGIE